MKLTKVLSTVVVALTYGMFAQSAQAAPTILMGQGLGLSTFNQFTGFEQNLTQNTVITNQFAASGVTFSALGNGAVRFDGCGNNTWNGYPGGLSGHTLGTFGPGCQTNFTDDSFSMTFANTLQAASFGAYFDNRSGTFTLQALLNGIVQSSIVTGTSSGYTVISGGLFNEIRILENAPGQSYVFFDNLAMQYGAAVPAPGALALLGLGLLGLGGFRRNRKAA